MEKGNIDELNGIRRRTAHRNAVVMAAIIALLLISVVPALMVGTKIPFFDIFGLLLGDGTPGNVYIIRNLQVPRMLCAALIGAALSVSGLAMQGLFRNPMASPSVLGVSSGAAFGASLAIGFGFGSVFGSFAVPALAFIFCFGTMFLVYILARTGGGVSIAMLLLAGIAVGAFFNGMVSAIQYVADDKALPDIVFWLMGRLWDCHWDSFKLALIPIVAGIMMIWLCSNELNLISLGEEQAENLGVNVGRTRIILLVGTSLAVAGAVSISGIIGFVGLIIPHIFRMIVGPDHRILIPLSIVGGAAFLIVMDIVSRLVISPNELPIGILTALLGAPFFIYIMRTKRKFMMGGD